MKYRKVNSRRNSICTIPLSKLDWNTWWTDTSGGQLFLHVGCKVAPPGEDTVWCVWCRDVLCPRLMMRDGILYWLIDEGNDKKA